MNLIQEMIAKNAAKKAAAAAAATPVTTATVTPAPAPAPAPVAAAPAPAPVAAAPAPAPVAAATVEIPAVVTAPTVVETTSTDTGSAGTGVTVQATAPTPAVKAHRRKAPKLDASASAQSAVATVAQAAPAQNTAVAVADRDDAPVALATVSNTPLGTIAGEISSDDLKLPRLVAVQSVGDLSTVFPQGSILLDGEVVLAGPSKDAPMKASEEVLLIPMKAAVVYRENFDYKDQSTKDKIPREFSSVEAMREAGGVDDFNRGVGHFRKAMNLLCAISIPLSRITPTLEPYFVDIDEEASIGEEQGVALCVSTVRFANSAFNSAGKTIITDSQRTFRSEEGGLLAGLYAYKMVRRQLQTGDWIWVPELKLLRSRTPLSTRRMLSERYSS